MRDSLVEAIRNVQADDAPRFDGNVYVGPEAVVDALVVWLRQNSPDLVAIMDGGPYLWLADLLSEET